MLIAAVVVVMLLHAVGHALWWWHLTEPGTPTAAGTTAPTVPGSPGSPVDRSSGSLPTFPPWSDGGGQAPVASEPTTTASTLPTPAVPAYTSSCLRRDNPPTGATFPADDPFGDQVDDLGEGAELQRLYAVRDGALVAIDGLGAPRSCDLQLWDLVNRVAPLHVKYLEEFLVFDADPNPAKGQFVIDGEAVPKRVTNSAFDDNHWRLAFAPNGLDRSELAWLVAHELAHIVSLNDSQTTPVQAPVCDTVSVGSGCLEPAAILNRYISLSWDAGQLQASRKAESLKTAEERVKAGQELYAARPSSFVTRYAATNPVEDFAEAFAMWCTVKPTDRARRVLPTAKPIDSGSKVAWFDTARADVVPTLGPGCAMLTEFAAT